MEPLIVIFDVVSALAFGVAVIYALRLPLSPGRGIELGTKLAMVIMMFLYAFVGISNIFEHAQITAILDPFEDYFEVLFVPLFAYAAISSAAANRLRRELQIQQELRVERDFSSSVMNATPAGIILVDGSGIYQFSNERAQQLLGEVAEDAFSGGPVFIERDGAFPEPRTLAEIAADGILEARRFTIMGIEELRVLAITAAPMAEEGVIVSMLDATSRVLSERELDQYRHDLEILVERRTEQLVEANLELEAANAAKKAFLANMSHELRSPLNAVLGFAGVLQQGSAGELNAEQHQQVEMIREAGGQLLGLVNEVLDIARIESGQLRVEFEPVDLGVLLTATRDEFATIAADAGVTLTVDIADDPGPVRTDRGKLGQVLRNLVANAIKFTPRGGEVTLALLCDSDDVALRVRDTGVGIAPYDQGRVFSAFYQATPPGPDTSHGAGLGLAIVRELCELIGARVDLQSAPGYGSTFTVKLARSAPLTRTSGPTG